MVGAVVVLQKRDEGVQEVVRTQKNQLLQDICEKPEKREKAAAGRQIFKKEKLYISKSKSKKVTQAGVSELRRTVGVEECEEFVCKVDPLLPLDQSLLHI